MSFVRTNSIPTTLLLCCLCVAAQATAELRTDPVGEWTFDNADSLLAAGIGNDLELVGSHEGIPGPEDGDGAIRIDVGSYYRCYHDIPANGDGDPEWVNRFTLVMDVMIPQLGPWYCFYQTNYNNSNDGDWFVNPTGHVGVGDTGYSFDSLTPGEWYRLAISVNLGEHYDYYLDGQLLHNGGPQVLDGRFSLYPAEGANQVLFFADEDGEDNAIDVAGIWLYDTDLSAQELADLGGYGHVITGPPDYDMQPYLQTPTPTSIHIGWHSADGFDSTVEYGLDESLESQATGTYIVFDSSTVWHDVLLEGLEPDTSYYYRCSTAGEVSELHRFTTQPPDDAVDMHVRFVVYGDNRTEPAMHAAVVQAFRDKVTELHGADLDRELNLVLNVGDIVSDGWVLSQYQSEYFFPVSSVSGEVPFMVSIGNHEAEATYYYDYVQYDDFAGTEGEKYYEFSIGPVLFIALNSNTIGDTQLSWLEGMLDEAEANSGIDWVFVYTHHPGHSEIWPDGNTAWIQDEVIPLLVQYSKVEGLFYGHSHNYERGAPDEGSLRLLLSGGGGSALDRWGMYSNQQDYHEILRAHDYYCYVLFDIDCAGRSYTASSYSLGHEDRPMDNELFDSFSRHLDAAPPQTPQAVSPAGSGPQAARLVGSDYLGEHPIMSSRFQLAPEGGDWSAAIVDTIRHWENVYGDSGAPDWVPLDLNEGLDLTELQLGEDLLDEGDSYQWRVRYRDRNLMWSEWSDAVVFSVIVTGAAGMQPPLETTLAPCLPNPFNPSTSIRFTLAAPSRAGLTVYDLKGRRVRELTSGLLAAGEHVRIWDGRDIAGRAMPAGLYLVRLETDHGSIAGKAILLK